MALLATNNHTMADWAKRIDPNGEIAMIVEMLSQSNEMLMDIPFMEGNLPTGHRTTIRTGLPKTYWRMINQPARKSKSKTQQVDEQAALLEVWSEVDSELVRLQKNQNAYRLQEANSFIEAMSQEMQRTLIYGGAAAEAPAEFPGFAQRYNDLTDAENKQNIIDGGGTGTDNTSIWIVCWGNKKVQGIFPRGTQAGLQRKDWGENIKDINTNEVMAVFREQFMWRMGLLIEDWRYAVRIANIDASDLVGNAMGVVNLIELLIKGLHRLPVMQGAGKTCIYANRTVIQMLDIQRTQKATSGTGINYLEIDGKYVPHFRGVPIRRVDQILNTEARVV